MILSGSDLVEHLGGVADDGRYEVYLDRAEHAVAAHIGAESFEVAAGATQLVYVVQNTRRLILDEGPLETLTSAVDSENSATTYEDDLSIRSPWVLQLEDAARPGRGFSAGQVVVVTYDQGYDEGNVPKPIRLAILQAAEWLKSLDPDSGKTSESIGDYSYTRRPRVGMGPQVLPDSAIGLLARYVQPGMAW
jgi:hypothetical protein